MIVVKTFEISEEETLKIKKLYHRLVTLRNLVKTSVTSGDEEFEPLMEKLTEVQVAYDAWFQDKERDLKVLTSERNRWDMNFETRKLSLMEI